MSDLHDPYELRKMEGKVLVFNAGSSSVRWALFEKEGVWRGRLGAGRHQVWPDGSPSYSRAVSDEDRLAAVDHVLDFLQHDPEGPQLELASLDAVGHRVLVEPEVAGAASAVVLDEELADALEEAAKGPWDQRKRMAVMRHLRKVLPGVMQVAVFDSAHFRTLPEAARRYGLPQPWADEPDLWRRGYQGLSHKYAALRTAEAMERPVEELRMITAHLGHGASLCALDHGRAVDTTMGLTPLAGLISCQRSGDLDPGLLLHLMHREGLGPVEMTRRLNRDAGLLGLSGSSGDMLELLDAAEQGQVKAQSAVQAYTHNLRRHLGAMWTALDGCDALVFTGGVGEGAAGIRARACQRMGALGLLLDEGKNRQGLAEGQEVAAIHAPESQVQIWVVASDEERMIARETLRGLARHRLNRERQQQQSAIPIGVSAHHVHLSQEHVEVLFGVGHQLRSKAPLKQPGQFAAEERVRLVGPKGQVDRVRVLGPVRKQTQVEISRTEEFHLGIDAPVRNSGDLDGTPGLRLEGDAGGMELAQGVICARRHIHMSLADVEELGLRDRDVVMVEVGGERPLVFGDVLVRAKDSYVLEMHLDTDEANAAEISTGMTGRLMGIQSRPGSA
ncbi:MAG: acetate/propionate family kinase [Deltaproteobacteria bacterium]|nr:acetate/propionate family kinase [Deltaproteobacteria bacterium]